MMAGRGGGGRGGAGIRCCRRGPRRKKLRSSMIPVAERVRVSPVGMRFHAQNTFDKKRKKIHLRGESNPRYTASWETLRPQLSCLIVTKAVKLNVFWNLPHMVNGLSVAFFLPFCLWPGVVPCYYLPLLLSSDCVH